MGGSAAKERRRLKRLEDAKAKEGASKGSNDSQSQQSATTPRSTKSGTKTPNSNQKRKIQTSPRGGGSGKPFPRKARPSDVKKTFRKNDRGGARPNGKGNANAKTPPPKKQKKKVKKPKHLAKKMSNCDDPKVLAELKKMQEELEIKKSERAKKFKSKVVDMCGGPEFFNDEVYQTMMANGGGKLEKILEAVKIDKNTGEMDQTAGTSSEGGIGTDASAENNTDDDSSAEESKDTGGESNLDAESNVTHERADDGKSKTPSSSVSSSSDSGSDSDSDSDSDSCDEEADVAQQTSRSRGRRRRGRQEADAKREEENAKVQEESKKKVDVKDDAAEASKKTPRSEDKRRCIGRKPLTDFEIGKKYSGTVKYVKPTLGVFIDIGCHSDAFCHISRVADDYVESISEDIYKVGDVLDNKVRIVEIDRKKKRITASLQSDTKIADEDKSLQARKERKEARENKRRKVGDNRSSGGGMSTLSSWTNSNDTNGESDEQGSGSAPAPESEQKPHEEVPIIIDPDTMTPAELKRARKLQRRAERRKMQELTGIAA